MANSCRSPSPLRNCENISDPGASEVEDDIEDDAVLHLTVHLHNQPVRIPFYHDDPTLQHLSDAVAEDLHIPPENQKFLVTPKTGLLKPPFKDPHLPLHTLQDKKIVLLGATTAEVHDLENTLTTHQARQNRRATALRAARKLQPSRHRDQARQQASARFTFHSIRPLPYLPDPDKSLRFLHRLAGDAGIQAAMRRHGFSVGLLTEMDPAAHTTHESRTLGLNRNRGEAIELRLRTDAGDGYRDYRVIRKTLCHELAHNVWGAHDANFWSLCREIEAEVERNDWRRGGHSVGRQGEEFYNPDDQGVDDEEADGGGWVGGEYTLGGAGPAEQLLTRREIMAQAAEERRKRDTETLAQGPSRPSSRSPSPSPPHAAPTSAPPSSSSAGRKRKEEGAPSK